MKQHETKFRFVQLKSDNKHKLFIYDEVRAQGDFNWKTWDYEDSETSAKYFRDRLDEIPNGEEIELHVNSAGGEVGEGVTIYNLLKQKSEAGSRIVGYVDGTAYSVAMNIVLACDEIHMGLGTSMLLHNPWTIAMGNAEALRNVADQLDVLSAASRGIYLDRAKNLTEEELIEMMDKETMLDPKTCLELGFCDYVGEKKDDQDPDEEPTEEPEADETEVIEEPAEELEEEPTEEDPDEDPDNTEEPETDEPSDDDDEDDKDKQVKQLKEQLFRQKQINQTFSHLARQRTKKTLMDAFTILGGKHND